MIAEFPKFTKLDIQHQNEIKNITDRFEPYSDFNFISMFSWNFDETTKISLLDNNLVIQIPDYLSGSTIYSIIGNRNIDNAIKSILKLTDELSLVPEIIIDNIKNKDLFIIKEDRDNHDYIVDSNDISKSIGLPKKNILITKFLDQHPGIRTDLIDLSQNVNKQLLLETFKNWQKVKNLDTKDLPEFTAINRLTKFADKLDSLYAIGVYENTNLIAFNTFDISNKNYGVSSFQKAGNKDVGLYAYLTQQLAKNLHSLGCKYINFEQDLGIDGLRNSKLSYHPIKFLKKYRVNLA